MRRRREFKWGKKSRGRDREEQIEAEEKDPIDEGEGKSELRKGERNIMLS